MRPTPPDGGSGSGSPALDFCWKFWKEELFPGGAAEELSLEQWGVGLRREPAEGKAEPGWREADRDGVP